MPLIRVWRSGLKVPCTPLLQGHSELECCFSHFGLERLYQIRYSRQKKKKKNSGPLGFHSFINYMCACPGIAAGNKILLGKNRHVFVLEEFVSGLRRATTCF